ncbi:MFS transporter [Catenulispora rubra]|uniref:MFS transporter n=1 Tax=Catenulispora rubra TaxID=280293 RepID=UPI00189200CB|nr:MFS transporter [Catenulispora rubra]
MSEASESKSRISISAVTAHWRITVLGTLILLFAIGIAYYSTAVLLDSIVARTRYTTPEVGGAVGVCFAVVCCVSPIVGWSIAKIGARTVVMTGGVLIAASVSLLAVAGNVITVYLGFIGLGLGAAAGGYIAVFVIIVATTGSDSASVIGVAATGAAIGGVITGPTLSGAVHAFGYTSALIGMGLIALVGVSALAMGLPSVKNAAPASAEAVEPLDRLARRSHLTSGHFWAFTTGTSILFGVSSLVELQLVVTASDRRIGPGVTAFTVGVLVSVFVRLLTPLALNLISGPALALVLFAMQLLSLLLVFVTPWWPGYLIGAMLIGACVGAASVLVPILLTDIFGKPQFRTLLAMTYFASGIVGLVIPIVTGSLYQATGDYILAGAVLALLTVAGAAGIGVVMVPSRQQTSTKPDVPAIT